MKEKCPLCGGENCVRQDGAEEIWKCKEYNVTLKLGYYKQEEREKVLNLALTHLLKKPFYKVNGMNMYWFFISNKDFPCESLSSFMINLADEVENYPDNIVAESEMILHNLALLFPNYGEFLKLSLSNFRLLLLSDDNRADMLGKLNLLHELGYLRKENETSFFISIKGWQKIEEDRKRQKEINQAFIAMSFRDETKTIRECFKTAIKENGYIARVIDEKEHNNQIVPEIFFEIRRSKFVVVDVTYPNYGAYYEAGYAQALGKQVIICCRKKEFEDKENKNRPHFDISQKAMVVWEDEKDLIVRLKRRIEATVKE